MKPETLTAITMLLKADATIAADRFREVVAACRREQRKQRRLITVGKAAEMLACHPKTIERYARKGLLTLVRFSPRKVRYDQDEVEAFARDGIVDGTPKEPR